MAFSEKKKKIWYFLLHGYNRNVCQFSVSDLYSLQHSFNKTSPIYFSFLEASHGTCVSNVPNHSEMFDRFERKLSPLWYKITGGQVGTGCGVLSDGKSLYFNGPGKREARTVPLDTTNIRSVISAASHNCVLMLSLLCYYKHRQEKLWNVLFFFFSGNHNPYKKS